MDFIIDLLIDKDCTTVLTMVDHFSNKCMFIPLSSTTAEYVARAFFQHMVAHHGLPYHIINDRDPRFTRNFWRLLMKEIKTELHFSTAFHPHLGGLAEVSNCLLKQLLWLHCWEGKWVDQFPMLALLCNAMS